MSDAFIRLVRSANFLDQETDIGQLRFTWAYRAEVREPTHRKDIRRLEGRQ